MNIQQFWSAVLAQRADEIREYFRDNAYEYALTLCLDAVRRL